MVRSIPVNPWGKSCCNAVQSLCPERGDIVWLNFTPQAGHEQAGHCPALVLSPKTYNRRTGMMLCCPLTTQIKGYPFEVLIQSRNVPGVALADQIKSMDWKARRAIYKDRADADVIEEVLAKARVLLQPFIEGRIMFPVIRVLVVAVLLVGCKEDNDDYVCSASVEPGIRVEVRNGLTDEPLAALAFGEVVDGNFHDEFIVIGFGGLIKIANADNNFDNDALLVS